MDTGGNLAVLRLNPAGALDDRRKLRAFRSGEFDRIAIGPGLRGGEAGVLARFMPWLQGPSTAGVPWRAGLAGASPGRRALPLQVMGGPEALDSMAKGPYYLRLPLFVPAGQCYLTSRFFDVARFDVDTLRQPVVTSPG